MGDQLEGPWTSSYNILLVTVCENTKIPDDREQQFKSNLLAPTRKIHTPKGAKNTSNKKYSQEKELKNNPNKTKIKNTPSKKEFKKYTQGAKTYSQ